MDNLAHTLVGAALGRAVAGRDVPAAGWIGAIAGNAPDWAELLLRPGLWARPAGGEYLVYHRGITHSFLGAAVEIVALTGVVTVLLRLWAHRARRRNRRESPLPRLAGILRFATVPSLERAMVLRRLARYRRSFFLAGTARVARVGRAPPLETGAGVPRHALGRHDSRGVARRPSRRVVGARGDGRVRRGQRGGLDAALVRGGRAPPRRGVWAGGARGLHRRACRGERPGQSADPRRRDTAVRTRCLVGGAHDPGAPLSLGSGLRVAGQRRGTGMGRGSTPRPSRGACGASHSPRPRDRAIRAVPRGGGGFEQRGRARVAVGCALPRARVGRRWLGQRAGSAAMSH